MITLFKFLSCPPTKFVFFCFAFFALSFTSYSQTRSLTTTYNENFNSLANTGAANTWTNDGTIDGWQASQATYAAGTGSSNNGDLYSFGAAASADRALGSLASSATATVTFGSCYTNNTGFTIGQLAIGFTGEQYRVGSTPALGDTLTFSYQIGVNSVLAPGAWTLVSALNFQSPTISPNNAPVDGNVAPNRTIVSPVAIAVNIPNGGDFCIRWQDLDNTGADYGASIDDFSLSFITVSAAQASVRGRVTGLKGQPLSRVTLSLLNTNTGERYYARSNFFGYFGFYDLPIGDFYILGAQRKGYEFQETSFQLFDNLEGLEITGGPSE